MSISVSSSDAYEQMRQRQLELQAEINASQAASTNVLQGTSATDPTDTQSATTDPTQTSTLPTKITADLTALTPPLPTSSSVSPQSALNVYLADLSSFGASDTTSATDPNDPTATQTGAVEDGTQGAPKAHHHHHHGGGGMHSLNADGSTTDPANTASSTSTDPIDQALDEFANTVQDTTQQASQAA